MCLCLLLPARHSRLRTGTCFAFPGRVPLSCHFSPFSLPGWLASCLPPLLFIIPACLPCLIPPATTPFPYLFSTMHMMVSCIHAWASLRQTDRRTGGTCSCFKPFSPACALLYNLHLPHTTGILCLVYYYLLACCFLCFASSIHILHGFLCWWCTCLSLGGTTTPPPNPSTREEETTSPILSMPLPSLPLPFL